MMLSVLWVLVLSALSSASPLDIRKNTEQKNDLYESAEMTANSSIPTDQPPLAVAKLRQKREVQPSSFMSDYGSNLEWVTWNGSLPDNAVSIDNEYVGRTDYVCKYECEAGFYTPSKGPYCHYADTKGAYSGSPFEILVNKNNFEILEWNEGSHGSVPSNSVRTCPGKTKYVGKNEYGLGEVSTQDKAFYLPWKGKKYKYNSYQVLTINENIISQRIYDVKYNTDKSKIINFPPEIVRKTTISNYECHSVPKTDTISKTYQVEKRWNIMSSIKADVRTSFSVGIPFITKAGIEVSIEVMLQASGGNTMIETITDTDTMQIVAPPNHSCNVNMVWYKYKINIPFTARLSRTYANGEVRTESISGMYDSVQTGEVKAEVDRCEPLVNSKPCT